MQHSPMVTPGAITQLDPIQVLLPIVIGAEGLGNILASLDPGANCQSDTMTLCCPMEQYSTLHIKEVKVLD